METSGQEAVQGDTGGAVAPPPLLAAGTAFLVKLKPKFPNSPWSL